MIRFWAHSLQHHELWILQERAGCTSIIRTCTPKKSKSQIKFVATGKSTGKSIGKVIGKCIVRIRLKSW